MIPVVGMLCGRSLCHCEDRRCFVPHLVLTVVVVVGFVGHWGSLVYENYDRWEWGVHITLTLDIGVAFSWYRKARCKFPFFFLY